MRATVTANDGAPDQLVVRMAVDSGWHIHANPASLPFLIATEVDLGPDSAGAEVHYPEGRELRPDFAKDSIRVYDGDVEISVRLRAGAAPPPRVALRFQACDDRLCLPPSRTELALERP